jgi:predicted ATPase
MLSHFALRDFKGHRDTQLELGRFTMLVGDNASGKTSVLDALALPARFRANPTVALVGDFAPQDLVRRGCHECELRCRGVSGANHWQATVQISVKPHESLQARQSWSYAVHGEIAARSFSAAAFGESGGAVTDQLGKPFRPDQWARLPAIPGSARIYRLRVERIAAAAYSDKADIDDEPDGTNTAVALAAMKLGDDEGFQLVEDSLRRLVPSVERIRIHPERVQHPSVATGVVGSKLYFDFRGAPGVPAHHASHGTLILLALLTVMHRRNRPDLILLDDFDHALHPRAQMELVRLIKQLLSADEMSDVQVVATTHSPYVVDELEPSEVYAFALRDDGTVASKRLSEHPEAEKTQGTLKAGQLWSLDPERDWVLRG